MSDLMQSDSEYEVIGDFWTYGLRYGDTLTNHDWVPFEIGRFLTSRFVAMAIAADGRADAFTGIVLWMESFRQDPAGSLPDDDVELARLAGFGRDVAAWRAARDGALYGWRRVDIEGAGPGDVPRLGHRLIEKIACDMVSRKKGRAQSRTASDRAVKRTRIKKMMVKIGNTRMADNPAVLEAVTSWIIDNSLFITEENVRAAMETAGGVPRVVKGPGAG